MKRTNLPQYLLIFSVILINLNCEKERPSNGRSNTNASSPPPPPPSTNTAPVVDAGPDIRLEIPTTHTMLSGNAYDANSNIKDYHWIEIAGPESYFLESPYNLSPKLAWLEEGEYEFELTATDKDGLSARDTVKVTVFSNLKKYILSNLIPAASGFSISQIPTEVADNLKWVFGKSAGRCEQADAGPNPGIDYNWGGYYYELLPGNIIAVYGGYAGYSVEIIIYY